MGMERSKCFTTIGGFYSSLYIDMTMEISFRELEGQLRYFSSAYNRIENNSNKIVLRSSNLIGSFF